MSRLEDTIAARIATLHQPAKPDIGYYQRLKANPGRILPIRGQLQVRVPKHKQIRYTAIQSMTLME